MFSQGLRPGLADCAPSGRARLDALARWLQDVAYADVEAAGLAHSAVWVIRRARLQVRRFPHFGERLHVSTFCSGLGRMWAERRTTVRTAPGASGPADGEGRDDTPEEAGADVEAVALWVHLDPATQRPTQLTSAEIDAYGGGPAIQRRVTARLRHPAPAIAGDEPAHTWRFRATDCDVAGHVNNSAYWLPLEEEWLTGTEPWHVDVEIEYRTPAQPGDKPLIREGPRRWILGPDGQPHASIVIAAAS